MRHIKYIVWIVSITFVFAACMGNKDNNADANTNTNEQQATADTNNSDKEAEAQIISQRLCTDFPREMIMKYNPDGVDIKIAPVSNVNGGILHCDVKLFYGKKEYEFWKGQVAAWTAKQKDPFWQYNPERNPALYHKIEGFGEQAVFITNTNQLLILKDGIVYDIVPPNSGRTTNTGKENKEIALEIARHYKI